MKYILGIDQGGTNTRAAIMDLTGTILGYGKTHGSYFPRDTMDVSLGIISKAVNDALLIAKLKIEDISMIVVGITGIDYEGDDIFVKESFREFFGIYDVHAFNDCVVAYYGGSIEAVGSIICVGTGVNAAFFTPENNIFVMSDYLKASIQGGSAIAKCAAEAVFESKIGVWPETKLEQMFLDFAQVDTTHEVLKKFILDGDFSKKITYLTPQILKIANGGDQVAQMILQNFSDELCACFLGAMRQMKMVELDCDIVLAGSVYKGTDNYLRKTTTETLLKNAKNARIVNACFEPVVGACIMGVNKIIGGFDENMRKSTFISAAKFELNRV